MKRLVEQIFKFGIVGFICFFIDYTALYLFTEFVGIPYLTSSGLAFTISVVVNYILSMKFVFDSKAQTNKLTEFLIFVVLSLVGLGLNQVIMWFTVEKMHIYYMLAKIIATALVMVYNFISRKLVLEK